jgi:preprotein translocase subunit SecG
MYGILIGLFVIVAVLMTISILMQSSKGGGLAASFGGMGAGGVLGPRGAANFLQKTTTVLAISYGLLCLIIGFVGRPTAESGSVIQRQLQQQQQQSAPSSLPIAPIQGDDALQLPQSQPPAEESQPSEEGETQ